MGVVTFELRPQGWEGASLGENIGRGDPDKGNSRC